MRISQTQNVAIRGHVGNPDGSDMPEGDISAVKDGLDTLGGVTHDAATRAAFDRARKDFAAPARWTPSSPISPRADRSRRGTLLNGPLNEAGDGLARALPTLAVQ